VARYSYKNALDRLTDYAISEGYAKIAFDHEGVSMIEWHRNTLNEPKSIHIEGKHTLEIKTYLMLHELGHHELRKDWTKFESRFPMAAYAEYVNLTSKDKRYKRRNTYLVASLEEEFLAWDEGLKLAKLLKIKVNIDRWFEFKSKCLKSYINYYANLKK
jgi:hypothetical protein